MATAQIQSLRKDTFFQTGTVLGTVMMVSSNGLMNSVGFNVNTMTYQTVASVLWLYVSMSLFVVAHKGISRMATELTLFFAFMTGTVFVLSLVAAIVLS